MRRARPMDLLVLTVAAWALAVVPANAYIDAGSVTIVFQALVAGLAAGWFAVKLGWRRVQALFRRGDDGPDGVIDVSDGPAGEDVAEQVAEPHQR